MSQLFHMAEPAERPKRTSGFILAPVTSRCQCKGQYYYWATNPSQNYLFTVSACDVSGSSATYQVLGQHAIAAERAHRIVVAEGLPDFLQRAFRCRGIHGIGCGLPFGHFHRLASVTWSLGGRDA